MDVTNLFALSVMH